MENYSSWDLKSDKLSELGKEANALYKFLKDTEDFEESTEENLERISEIEDELETLKFKSDDSKELDPEILKRIEELESELEDISENETSVYSLEHDGDYYNMSRFMVNIPGLEGREYAVGNEWATQKSAEEYVEQLIDDIGYEGFRKGFYENFIDEERLADHILEFIEDDIYASPEAYLSDSDKELSEYQVEEIRLNRIKIQRAQSEIAKIEKYIEQTDNEEYIESSNERIDELNEEIEDLEIEISEIEDSPDGEYNDEAIKQELKSRQEDIKRHVLAYASDYGLELKDFIDHNEFVEAVVDEDGYGILSSYDGDYDVVNILGEDYYIVRIN